MAMQNFVEWLVVALRWAHIVAILGWVGASLYFMWLESKLRAPSPAKDDVLGEAWMGHGGGFYIVEKRRISPGQVPSPVYWFRVEAAVTWVTGFLLLVLVYYWSGGVELIDPARSPLSPSGAVGLALVLLVLGWVVYDGIWVSAAAERRAGLATALSLLVLFGVVYLLCQLFTGRAAFIHVGAILGTNMVASVWTRIIPAQEEAVAATMAGRERNPVLAMRARRRAQHNTYVTLPVIFTMIAVHAPGAYSHPLNWLILSLLVGAGIMARHLMILFDRRQLSTAPAWSAAAMLAASLAALGAFTAFYKPVTNQATVEHSVPFVVVKGIMQLRCGGCHSRKPAGNAIVVAPNGLRFDTDEEIAKRASMIKASIVAPRTMPPRNATGMTEEERALIARWAEDGARTD